MEDLNIHFLISGKQFNSKLNTFENVQLNTNDDNSETKCVRSAKNLKSDNFYQIKDQVLKYKNLN